MKKEHTVEREGKTALALTRIILASLFGDGECLPAAGEVAEAAG